MIFELAFIEIKKKKVKDGSCADEISAIKGKNKKESLQTKISLLL